MKSTDVDATFQTIVHYWQFLPRCEVTTNRGTQCRRSASWTWKFHDCSQGIMCTHHRNGWLRAVEAPDNCQRCGQFFATADDACTFTRL